MLDARFGPLRPLETWLAASWRPEDWKDVTVLVAVSGGGDSVALLRGLEAIRLPGEGRLIAVHVNHKLRGACSDADQQFVEKLCGARGVSCEVLVAAVDVAAAGQEQGIEAAARRARYAALEDLAGRRGARFVVTAHTADDQAETILHRVLRGTGIRGLAGMARVRRLGSASLLRPLLAMRRADLAAYLHDIGESHCVDASNSDVRFTRNRIRNELLPLLAANYNRSIVSALLQLGELAGESQSLVDAIVETTAERCLQRMGTELRLDAAILVAQPTHLVREILLHVWRREGWPLMSMGFSEWNALADMISTAAGQGAEFVQKRMFPGAILAELCEGRLRLTKTE